MESIPYCHTAGLMSVDDLLKTGVFKDNFITKNELLQYTELGLSNHERLYNNLTQEEIRISNNLLGSLEYNPDSDYPVTTGVLIYIPISKVGIPTKYESNISVTHTKDNEYFPPILRQLTNDPGYVSAELDKGNQAQQIYPKFTVWLWSRSKYLEGESGKGFVNITKDVINLNIESTLNSSGTFSIDLAPIQCHTYFDIFQNKPVCQPISINEASQSSINKVIVNKDSAESVRNLFYYEIIANENDMVFISFEKLKIDGEPSIDDVHDKWYDMIGLIDINTKSLASSGPELVINIRGRDLNKALMSDNSYFNPYSRGHSSSIYGGHFGDNGRFFNGKFGLLSAYLNKTIQQSIQFIISRVVTIGYIPDEVVSYFTSSSQIVKNDNGEGNILNLDLFTNTTINVTPSDSEKTVKGIWQLCKVFIDPSIENLKVVDDSVSNPDGSIYDLFNKIAQKPFIEFFTDTYGDKFYLIFRQPPFTQLALLRIFLDNDDQDINPDFAQYKTAPELPSGGATKDQINKYKEVQKNFDIKINTGANSNQKSEIFYDNEGHFAISETVVSSAKPDFNRVINISDKDVISDNLRNCDQSYAWYQITDRGNFAGKSVSLGIFPALYLNEYAQVFGNNRLEVVSNYSDYRFFNGQNQETQLNLFADQASQHLAFIVETNAYLPFTRMGIITINGDRRIKKGNWIYYRPTREAFYVTSVTNSISLNGVDRLTTVTVERGMVFDYIRGKLETITDQFGNEKKIKVSYFNIIDIPKLQKDTYDVIAGNNANDKFNYKRNIIVNEDVFNFFLQKRNFQNTQ